MPYLFRACAALCVALAVLVNAVSAQPEGEPKPEPKPEPKAEPKPEPKAQPKANEAKEGEFPAWNTWKLAFKDDWLEQSVYGPDEKGVIAVRNKVKFQVVDAKDGTVTFTRTVVDLAGKEGKPTPLTKLWSEIRITKPGGKVVWTDKELEISGIKLKCKVATWLTEGAKDADELWYSADLPCGGIARMANGGVVTMEASGFCFNGKNATRDARGFAIPTGDPMPKFFAKVGNSAVYKVTVGTSESYQLRKVTEITNESATYTVVPCDADGVAAAGAAESPFQVTRAEWAGKYKEATGGEVKIEVPAGEYKCNMYVATDADTETTTWISDGVIIKLVNKRGKSETSMVLAKLTLS